MLARGDVLEVTRHGPSSATARVAAYAFVAATFAIHAVVAWLSPLQGDDWAHLLWSDANAHRSGFDWLIAFASSHFTASDALGFVIARSTVVHAIATPAVSVALYVGLFTLAARRLPRLGSWDDVFGLVVISSLIWVGSARAGVTWFHRPYAATWIYGAAFAAWTFAPYRCRWRPRGAWVPAMSAFGLAAGSTSRQVGVVLSIGVIGAILGAPAPRPRWMWLGLAGVAIGTVAVWLDAPQIDFRGFKAGFEASLGAINVSLREGGELIALVLGLSLAKLVFGRLRPVWAGDEPLPDNAETMRWMWAWFGLNVLALLGPRYSEVMLFPGSLALCIAALPYIRWLATSRLLRFILAAVAVGIHVVVVVFALGFYVPLGAEFRERVAALERTPAGGRATLEPYRATLPSFWFYGEDWAAAGRRQDVAIELFGLGDIDFAKRFGNLEVNAGVAVRLEVDGRGPEALGDEPRHGARPIRGSDRTPRVRHGSRVPGAARRHQPRVRRGRRPPPDRRGVRPRPRHDPERQTQAAGRSERPSARGSAQRADDPVRGIVLVHRDPRAADRGDPPQLPDPGVHHRAPRHRGVRSATVPAD